MGTEKMGIPQVEWYLTRYFTLLGQEGNVPSNWMVYVGFNIYRRGVQMQMIDLRVRQGTNTRNGTICTWNIPL